MEFRGAWLAASRLALESGTCEYSALIPDKYDCCSKKARHLSESSLFLQIPQCFYCTFTTFPQCLCSISTA